MAAQYVVLSLASALWLGALTAGACTRLRFARMERSFRCRARAPSDRLWGVPPQWSCRTYALWTHDVLVIRRGLLRPRVLAVRVRPPHNPVEHVPPYDVTGLGVEPRLLRLRRLHDGTVLDVAVAMPDSTLLAGPFLAAVIPALPEAPPEPRRRDGWPPTL